MSNSIKNQRVEEVRQRVGEGVLVDLVNIPAPNRAGNAVIAYRVNIGSVPVPSKRYSTDVAFLAYKRNTIKLMFGQEKHSDNLLRTLLIIKMTPTAARKFLRTTQEAFRKHSEQVNLKPEVIDDDFIEPHDTVSFDSNIVLAAIAGREACCDFYHASSFSLASSVKSKKLALDPVVRVDLRATLLMGLLESLQKLISGLPSDIFEGEDNESIF